MKAQKKPIVIDYIPYDGYLMEVIEWVDSFGKSDFDLWFIAELATDNSEAKLFVRTLEGTSYQVTTDDVIIRGVKGEYYPCKKDIFNETYNIVP
jgi:hypothetical protein